MNILWAFVVAFNIFAGWVPTETNSVDAMSMLGFVVAAASAYAWGLTSK